MQVKLGATKLAWGILYLYAAWLVTFSLLHFSGSIGETLGFYPKASFQAMLDGSADKPYVGRMLVPALVKGISDASPDSLKNSVGWIFTNEDFLQDFYGVPKEAVPSIYPVVVLCVLLVFVYAGVAFGGRAVFISLFDQGGFAANVVGLLYLLAVPLWFRYVAYIYDPMTVLLATWILYAAIKSNVWLCCVLFVLACVNKETAPLLLPVILFGLSKKQHRYTVIGAGIALLAIAVLIHGYRQGHYDANGSSWLEHHWDDHQMVLIPRFLMSFLYALVVMGTFLWLALTKFKSKPFILRLGLVCTFVPLFLASIPFGYIDETRALFDSYPFVMLLAMPTALAIFGGSRPVLNRPA